MSTTTEPNVGVTDVEAEAAVLGAALNDPEVLTEVTGALKPTDFASAAHAAILRAMIRAEHNGLVGDHIVVAAELERERELGLGDSMDAAWQRVLHAGSEVANVSAYIKIIQDRALKRGVMRAARDLAAAANDRETSGAAAVAEAEKVVFNLARQDGAGHGAATPIGEAITRALDEARIRQSLGGNLLGVSTGFHALDTATLGFQPGQEIIVAGRPGMGKTSVALQMAARIAETGEGRVLFFSHEMTESQLSMRLLAAYLGMPLRDLKSGQLLVDHEDRIVEVAERLANLPLDIIESPPVTHESLTSMIRRQARQSPISAVFVDYVQMMKGDGANKNRTRTDELGEIAYGAKNAAVEMGYPVILLSQLNRGVEGRIDKRPMSSDLRGAGDLEQAADLIIFIHRPGAYDPEMDQSAAELLITKQRDGEAPLTIPLKWDGKSTRYLNITGVQSATPYTPPPSGGSFKNRGGRAVY